MVEITFVQASGDTRTITASEGESVMQAAMDNLVPGILADCGGGCACATSHEYIEDKEWRDRLTDPDPVESAMLEHALNVNQSSRLTCQIEVTPELDGLVVTLPASQI
jgi:2Fe-2S ferredoxin